MKRNAPLARRTRLRPKSKKREKLDVERRAFVETELRKRLYCEAGDRIGEKLGFGRRWPECWRVSSELHEPLTRARAPVAETILDVENSVAICRICHRWVHDHPIDATTLGLLRRAEAPRVV